MTGIERRNYRIAVIVSVAFHGLLLLIFFLKGIESKLVALETYPANMIELTQNPGDLHNPPAVMTTVSTGAHKNTGTAKIKSKSNPVLKNQPAKKPSSDLPLQNHSLKEGTKGEKAPVTGPSGTPAPTGPEVKLTQPAQDGPGNKDGNDNQKPSDDDKPLKFGSGEGMVSQSGSPLPYPKNAVNERKEGEVTVRILVHANGNLDKVLLLKSSGDSRLDKATINSITRDWRFKPASQDYFIELIFVFNLQSGVSVKFIRSETGQ